MAPAIDEYSEACQLFVLKLKEVGAIDNAMFSIFLDLENDNSKITFGGYDLERFAYPGSTEDDIVFHSFDISRAMWEIDLNYFTYQTAP